MGNTSEPHHEGAAARRILDACLAGERWAAADLQLLIARDSPALFGIVAEGLSDRFEPRLAEPYAEIFAEAIAAVLPEHKPADLVERYRRVRRVRFCEQDPRAVFVLSRVTLGADVAVTSVILDGVKRRFPLARIVFAGPRKSYELFAADARVEHLEVSYGRAGSPRGRIGVCPALDEPGSIVVDPDSRITQLGLLPVSPDDRYYFFDSRSYGGDGGESLGCLARRWVAETFGVSDARAYIAPAERPEPAAEIAVSLGVGGNLAKLVKPPFEAGLLQALAARGSLAVDAGAGGEEAARVARAAGKLPAVTWQGSFAGFASLISRARLYAGYDSAGQHVAAACGVPLVTVFAGAPSERFRERWRPTGPGPIEVIRAEGRTPEAVLDDSLRAVAIIAA
ncbi:MAG TPA: glycosyltransferase family 9 protein [Bryobacteraceae bacterium]